MWRILTQSLQTIWLVTTFRRTLNFLPYPAPFPLHHSLLHLLIQCQNVKGQFFFCLCPLPHERGPSLGRCSPQIHWRLWSKSFISGEWSCTRSRLFKVSAFKRLHQSVFTAFMALKPHSHSQVEAVTGFPVFADPPFFIKRSNSLVLVGFHVLVFVKLRFFSLGAQPL